MDGLSPCRTEPKNKGKGLCRPVCRWNMPCRSLSFMTRTQRGFEGDIERENVEGDELGGSRIM